MKAITLSKPIDCLVVGVVGFAASAKGISTLATGKLVLPSLNSPGRGSFAYANSMVEGSVAVLAGSVLALGGAFLLLTAVVSAVTLAKRVKE